MGSICSYVSGGTLDIGRVLALGSLEVLTRSALLYVIQRISFILSSLLPGLFFYPFSGLTLQFAKNWNTECLLAFPGS